MQSQSLRRKKAKLTLGEVLVHGVTNVNRVKNHLKNASGLLLIVNYLEGKAPTIHHCIFSLSFFLRRSLLQFPLSRTSLILSPREIAAISPIPAQFQSPEEQRTIPAKTKAAKTRK